LFYRGARKWVRKLKMVKTDSGIKVAISNYDASV
jgi:hypothetical protein